MLRTLKIVLTAGIAAATAILCTAPTGAAAAKPPTDLLWFNFTSGEVSTWVLDGHGTVLGAQPLDWRCDAASGCAAQWRPLGSGDMNDDGAQDVVWYNATTGEISSWLVNGAGTVVTSQPVDWHCDTGSGCAASWKPVGLADFDNDGHQDLMWFNKTTGEVSSWLLNGYGNVLRAQSVDWRCTVGSGCANQWRPVSVGGMKNDGRQDVMWINPSTGELSSWLLNGYGNVLTTQPLELRCSVGSRCLSQWRTIGIGDLNSDGNQDLTWY